MSRREENSILTRSDFVRLTALGAGGLGLAALAGCGSKTVVHEGGRLGYVVAVTHGPKDADRVLLALVTASRLPKGDNHVWFAIDGGQLCKKGDAANVSSPLFVKQGNAAKVLDEIRGQGTALHIWPSCADYYGVKGAVALEGLDEKGPDWLLEQVATHHLVWFWR